MIYPEHSIKRTKELLQDREYTDEQKVLMLAYIMGIPLEWRWNRNRPGGVPRGWQLVYVPNWNFQDITYRIEGT